jgi:hypothetical protein
MRGNRTLETLGILVSFLAVAAAAAGQSHATEPPPLPVPVGTTVNVSTEPELQLAVQQLTSNTTIVLEPGTYQLTRTLNISGALTNVGIRGATSSRDDVVLRGAGIDNPDFGSVPHGMSIGSGVQHVTVANLTIRDVYHHALLFNAGAHSPRVYNVHLLDARESLIKSTQDTAAGVDNGVVEYSVLEYTTMPPDAHPGGVEVHAGANWIIRRNVFLNIVAADDQPRAGRAVLMRGASRNTITEHNRFLNCSHAIAYGLDEAAAGFDHSGGIIRNNFVWRAGDGRGGAAISLANSPDTRVLNNTVYLSGTYSTPIEYRFTGTAAVVVTNNLLDGFVWARDGATGTEHNNLTGVAGDMFVDAAGGDLHLAGSATSAIDHGVVVADVIDDWDGQTRPLGSAPDIGADEYVMADVTAVIEGGVGSPSSSTLLGIIDPLLGGCPCSIWPLTALPARIENTDTSAVEVGVRFRADVNGTITGIRFYKGLGNTGPHVGSLWTNTGTRLATATFANETLVGWQQVTFSTPIAITANTTYVASYHMTAGRYAVTDDYFRTSGVDAPPLHALVDGAAGGNGVFVYGASAFPTQTSRSANYWVDVVFTPSAGDTTPPTAAIVSPASGATVSGTVTVSASASDNTGVAGVQFKIDGANVGAEDTTAPYDISWNTAATSNGSHTLVAVARDAAGNTRTSSPVTVTVANDSTAPTVAITAPVAGATVSGTAVIVSATASDNAGVVGVQFKLDGANLRAEDLESPYQRSWDTTTIPNGSHTLTAVARDAAGNTTTSAAVVVTVSNDTMAPAVSLTAPAVGTAVSGAAVAVSATASDDVAVVGVQFKLDGANLGAEDTAGPYDVSWDTTTASNGSHTLTAVARDAAGNTTTSAAVVVTVSNDTAAPTVSLTAPAAGATVSGSVMVAATASDDTGIAGVQFTLDGASLGAEDTTEPYGVSWDTAATTAGSHTLVAVARDAAGNTTASAPVTVTVATDTTAPTVTITAPAAGATVSGTAVVVSAAASDNVGVAGVQFKLDGANLRAEDPDPPYRRNWDTTTIANGSYTLTAVARDAAGNTTTSAAVAVTVFNDTTVPTVSLTTPAAGTAVSGGAVAVSATASDNVAVIGVQFKLDGVNLGAEDTASPYGVSWDTTTASNGSHTLTAVARDAAGNTTTAAGVVVTVSNDTAAPTVSLTAPAAGTAVSGAVAVSAAASDDVAVVGVQFKLDGANLGAEDTASPYGVSWNTTTVSNGSHTLTAIARDAAGQVTISAAVTVTVSNDTTAPSVTITAPADGAVVPRGTITVSAAASDNVAIAGVRFRVDGASLGAEDTTSPYSVSWDAAAATSGTHTLTAVARDAAGNTTTATVVVTVSAGDTVAPTVSITAPGAGATVSGSAVVLSAAASDDVGVAGVQFKLDGVNLGAEDTASPYSISWDTTAAANGVHTLTAVARDAAGNIATSAGVTVTVDNAAGAPTTVLFRPSADHAALVDGYLFEIFREGDNPNSASPVASSDLGKPAPGADGDISVDRSALFQSLPPGSYVATVTAIGSGGQARSAAVIFVR